MNRIIAMGMAYDILVEMAETRKISQRDYVEGLEDIRTALNVSEEEYLLSLESQWDGPVNRKEILDIN